MLDSRTAVHVRSPGRRFWCERVWAACRRNIPKHRKNAPLAKRRSRSPALSTQKPDPRTNVYLSPSPPSLGHAAPLNKPTNAQVITVAGKHPERAALSIGLV